MTPPQIDTRQLLRLPLYGHWVTSWEAALTAVRNADRTGALTADEAIRHRTVIAAERNLVINELTLLVGHAGDEVGVAASGARAQAHFAKEA